VSRYHHTRALALSILALLPAAGARAGFPEPDNLFFGTVTVNGRPLTAADVGVSVELSIGGSVIDVYTMGEDPEAGNRYVLSVPMDALGQRVAGRARPGDGAVIRYRTDGTVIQAAEVTIGERGATTALDLVVRDPSSAQGLPDWGALDSDGDGIPDATERALGLDPTTKDGDGPGGGWSDADGDGLPGIIEQRLTRTDPEVDDSDAGYCTPRAGGLSGQWDGRVTGRRSPAELADAAYAASYPSVAPADVAFSRESLIGLSICHEQDGLRVWAVGLGYADQVSLAGAAFNATWANGGQPVSVSATFDTAGALYPAVAGRLVGTWSDDGAVRALRLDRRSPPGGTGDASGVYGLQFTPPGGPEGGTAGAPFVTPVSGHLVVAHDTGARVVARLYDDLGRTMPAYFVRSVGGLFAANRFEDPVDTSGDGAPDSLSSDTVEVAGVFTSAPAGAGGMVRGEWTVAASLDAGDDGPGPGDVQQESALAFYARASAPEVALQTVNAGVGQHFTEVALANVPTSATVVSLAPPAGVDLGLGAGVPVAVVDVARGADEMAEKVRLRSRLPAFEDGERVGYADDGESLLVSALTHTGAPGLLLGAGSYAFTAAGMPGGVPLTVSAAYAPVPVPGGLLPVVNTLGGVSVDGAPVQTGAGNATPLFAGVRHALAWDRVSSGGRSGAGAGRYLVQVRRADGLELDLLGTDAFHLPLEAATGCQAAGGGRCELALPPLVPHGEDLELELVIEAIDAADPGNRSRTAGFFFHVARDGDNDGVEDAADNCLGLANPDQRDTDGDGYGNLCDPDLNNDGSVNFADLALLKQRFFTADADADLTGDGSVNFADLALLKSRFFGAPGPSAVAP
jgi:hypothetical protein